MRKSYKAIIIVMVLLVAIVGCGQDKYDELVSYNNQFVEITRDYIDGLNSAQNAEEVAKAMNKYSDEFSVLIPKMQKINEKYPGLLTQKDLPESVVQSQAEATKVGMEFASSFMKTMKYITDPKVAEAQQKMGQMMQSLNK